MVTKNICGLLQYDIIYISGNPYINSRVEIAGFNAKKHFYKVVDMWSIGLDDDLGTVPPNEINKATFRYYLKYPAIRFIIHYLQPHAPYLSAKFRLKWYSRQNPEKGQVISTITGYRSVNKYFEYILNVMRILFSKIHIVKGSWGLRERIELSPDSPIDSIKSIYGKRFNRSL